MPICKQCGEEITEWVKQDYDGYCYDCYHFFNQDPEEDEE